MKKVFVIAIPFILLIFACESNPKYVQLSGFTQGTTYTITYAERDELNYSHEIEAILEQVDKSMSLYRDSSVINLFNASESSMEVDSLLAQVVSLSLQISAKTNGAFDITIGPLVREWGFHMKKGEVPSSARVEELLSYTGVDKIEINGNTLTKQNPYTTIDVNAIAQGYTVDLLAQFLESKGIANYLVEVGGEVRTLGKNPRGKAWQIGVDKPVDNALSGENLQVILAVSGKSLVTSGNYRKFFIKDGVRYSHTISPATGYPVNHTLLSATVIDSTATRADALATAFMVMGVDSTISWLANNPSVEAYLIYSNPDGDYAVWMSDGLSNMIVEK